MKHTTQDFLLTLVALVAGGWAYVNHPEAKDFIAPIVGGFVGSWLRVLPAIANGNGNGSH